MLSMLSFDFHLPPCTEGFLIHLSPLWQLPLWQLPLFPSVAQFPCALCRISGGAMTERMYRLSVGVGLSQPVTRRQVALMAGLIFLA